MHLQRGQRSRAPDRRRGPPSAFRRNLFLAASTASSKMREGLSGHQNRENSIEPTMWARGTGDQHCDRDRRQEFLRRLPRRLPDLAAALGYRGLSAETKKQPLRESNPRLMAENHPS